MKRDAMGPGAKWIDINPDQSVCDAARRSLAARLAAVIHFLPLAAYHAEQDTEHVHRLRVSTRRAMAALKLYRDWLPRKPAKWVKNQLRKIRRTAGNARDLDVLAERLVRECGDGVAPLVARIAQERAAVQPAIVRLARRLRRGDRYVRKTGKLIHKIAHPRASSDTEFPGRFGDWARGQLAEMTGQFFSAQPSADADMAAVHRFRIRAKALRYAIEILAPAFGPELRKVHYPIVEELQERLGRINDHVSARDQLRTWSAQTEDAHDRDLFCNAADQEMACLIDELDAFREWWTPQRADELARGLAIATKRTTPPAAE